MANERYGAHDVHATRPRSHLMPWLKVDDGFHSHPKVMRAGTAAAGLWVRCGSYVAQHLTDGFVPREIARSYGTPAMARALVDAGLWVVADGGWMMHDYSTRNPSRAKVEEERAEATERQRKARDAAKAKRAPRGTVTDMSHRDTPPPVTDMSQRSSGAVTVPPYPARTQPVPKPASGGAELAPLDPPPDAGAIVAAFCDGATNAGLSRPGQSIRARVGKSARQLLHDGQNFATLDLAARRLGAGGWDDLEREVRRVEAERNPQQRSTNTDRATQSLTRAAELRAQESA